MESFFPKIINSNPEISNIQKKEILWAFIIKEEIGRALKIVKRITALGEDGLLILIWKNIWKYIFRIVVKIFTVSVNLRYYPKKLKTITIIMLRKLRKSDYSVSGIYRPISFFNTLEKLLEAVMVRRLSYYVETHGLFPDTQFGDRPGRTTEQALLVLANAIDRAWLKDKVVTLVAFDLKGAFRTYQPQS
jgi:hypothetical protein